MKRKDIQEIVYRVSSGNATPEDEQIATYWLHYFRRQDIPNLSEKELTEESDAIYRLLMAGRETKPEKVKHLWPRIAAAASIILCLSAGGYLLFHKQPRQQITQNQQHDIAPGGNKAILTLSNGKQIILTGAENGKLAEQGSTAINKTADGQVVYHASETGNPKSEIQYNTMSTPRGGQYHLTLADGTDVWLNAASSIKYPTAFAGNTRDVEITGEAYFEVAHNAAKPFQVSSNGQTVEVLGTHFNINAYSDETAIKTTLLEGSVKVVRNGQAAILKPGQQSIIQQAGHSILVKNMDTEQAIAWREGLFMFDEDNLDDIMRKISRWYDVQVVFTDNRLKNKLTSGSVSRFGNVSQVLRKIAMTGGVHFAVNGRTITVEPQ